MLDLQHGVCRSKLSSFHPVYQTSSKSNSSRTEFNFWDENKTKNYEKRDDSCQIEFRTGTGIEDDYSACSPPFWTNTRHEASTLLPHNHHYSFVSPTSRLQVIADGRRELMQMAQNMPESSYELSLKDIIDDHISMQGNQKDVENKIGQEKKKSSRRVQMMRSESMDSGVFLLKMFLPACLSSKKKSTLGNRSKVSRRPSFDRSEKPVDKEWWNLRFLISRQDKNSCSSSSSSSSSSGSTSCISSSRSRHAADSKFTPGCFSFHNLREPSRQRGCLF